MTSTEKTTPLRAWCRRVGLATLIATSLLGVLAALEILGPLLVPGRSGEASTRLIGFAAPVCYLWALAQLGRTFLTFAAEGRFVGSAASALKTTGAALLIGAIFHIVVAPSLERALGAGPGYVFGFDVAEIALGLMGLALMGFARLFERAARLERELDAFL